MRSQSYTEKTGVILFREKDFIGLKIVEKLQDDLEVENLSLFCIQRILGINFLFDSKVKIVCLLIWKH